MATAAARPARFSLVRASRVTEYRQTQYRRSWRGTLFNSFLNPVLFLLAMGVGLGTLIDDASAGLPGGVGYLDFIAPAVLASTAMTIATFEATYPILASVKWMPVAVAQASSPVRPEEVAVGEVMWAAFRVAVSAAAFLAVIALFGATSSPLVVLAVPSAVLMGCAFAAPFTALSIRLDNDNSFATLQRLVVLPMFLFSGTFFPVDELPVALRPVAWLTPLWHGVELCRSFATGTATVWASIGHVAYLALVAGCGLALAMTGYRRRLAS